MTAGYFFSDFPYYDKKNNLCFLKCLSFIFIHPEYGPMIFDTGSPYKTENTINSLKNKFGLMPDDIKWVFITHIHPDHTGGNFLFKNARIIFSKLDFDFAKNIAEIASGKGDLKSFLHTNCPGYKNFYDDDEIKKMKDLTKKYWNEERLGCNLDIEFIENNPSIPPFIKILPSPGHTFHHYSYKIEINNTNLYITGDSISNRQVLNSDIENRLLEPHMDFNKYFESLDQFTKYKGIFIPGHDRPFYSETKSGIRKELFEINDL